MALGWAAILTVYAIGYARTQDAADLNNASSAPDVGVSTPGAVGPGSGGSAVSGGSALAQPTATPGALMNGTYVGSGTSRHGGIEATVVVAAGKISSVAITQCLTRYPCTWIADLPGQVVAQQNANVDLVSGASDSSRAFIQAVSNALARAR